MNAFKLHLVSFNFMVCIIEILWADRSFSAKILDGIQIRKISYIGSGSFAGKIGQKVISLKKVLEGLT